MGAHTSRQFVHGFEIHERVYTDTKFTRASFNEYNKRY